MRLDLFVKLKYESSTILFVGIRHSMRDLLSDLNNCLTRKWAICVRYGKWCQRFLSGISSSYQAVWILHLNDLLDGDLRKNFFYLHIFSLFSGFKTGFYQMRWFYTYCSFKHSKSWRHKL